VNRALGRLAEEGLVDRRRRAGTRVLERPQRAASFEVGLIRDEVERTGKRYAYELVEAGEGGAPEHVRERLGLTGQPRVMRVLARHLAGGEPFAWEERWINGGTVPRGLGGGLATAEPQRMVAGERALYLGGGGIDREPVGAESSRALGCAEDSPLLTLERTTWWGTLSVTHVAFRYAPGYRMWSRSWTGRSRA
jgi:GntR family histidine utilization transcriptional repressor